MITFDTFYTIQRVSGLSQDDKPLGMKPGSIFMELDTGKTFIFDGETWHEQPSGGGGDEWELIKEIPIAEEVSYVEETFAKTYRRFLMRINSPNLSANRVLVFMFNGKNSNTFQNNAMTSNKKSWTGELEITDAFIKTYSGIVHYYNHASSNIQPFGGNIYGGLVERNSAMLNAGDKGIYSVKINANNAAFLAGDTITFFGVPI